MSMFHWLAEKGVMDATLGHRFIAEGLMSTVLKECNSMEEVMCHKDTPTMAFSSLLHVTEVKNLHEAIMKVKQEETKELEQEILSDIAELMRMLGD